MTKLPFNLVKRDENTNIGEINIEGIIGESFWGDGITKEDIKADLEIVKASKMSKLVLNINSLGGDVNHALSIFDMLKDLDVPVIAKLNGFVASSATIIAMAADQVEMSENSFYLIHKPMTMSMGNSNEMTADLDFLQKLDETLLNIYSQRVDKKKCEALLNEQNGNGKWLTADEAKEYGFIDSITKKEKREKKEEAVLNSVDAKRMGLPEIIGVPVDTPEGKNFVEKIIDKIFGTPEDKTIEKTSETTIIENETIVETEDPMDPEEDETEDIVEDTIEAPVLSLVEENDLRITNLEKQVIDLISQLGEINNRIGTIVNEKESLQAENETLTKVIDEVKTEKVILEQKVVALEDEPLTLPINLSPEGKATIGVKKEIPLNEKRMEAYLKLGKIS